jgi:endonuclease YncB( thermonuclease family)
MPLRSVFPLVLLFAAAVATNAADTFAVIGVPAPDRVVVQYRGLPVNLSLAHLSPPADEAQRQACQDRLTALLKGVRVSVIYLDEFGTDAGGVGRVQLATDKANINETLVSAGLATYSPGGKPDSSYEGSIRRAQDKAKKAKVGVWAETKAPVVAAKPAAKPVAEAAAPAEGGKPKPPFCSELDNPYYYPTGHPAVADVNPQRLIYYVDEGAAKRAGKKVKVSVADSLPTDNSEASGDAAYAIGKETYARAIAAGNTPERDELYEQAYVQLTKGMQIYSALAEKNENDEKLANKLRECMQLRYGSVKQRRFH